MTVYLGTDLIAGVTTTVDKSERIGQIIQSTIPLTDAGVHLLDGSLIQGGGIYDDFVTYISNLDTSADYFCTEADWQTSVTNYGSCDKYVYDDVNNTVRIPKRTSEHGALIKSYSSGTDWYRIYQDGWCEQGGYIPASSATQLDVQVSFLKQFADTNYSFIQQKNLTSNGTVSGYFLATNNKTTSSIYIWNNQSYILGTYWQACGYIDISDYQYSPIYEYLVIATSTKTEIEVDIDEIATDLNGKVSKADCSTIYPVISTYVNGTSWYRIYSDGWCEQGGEIGTGTTTVTFLKTFASIPLCWTLCDIATNQNASGATATTTGLTFSSYSVASRKWQASGYLAEEEE